MKKASRQKSPNVYQIKLEGILPKPWKEWFEGLTITYEGRHTILSGSFEDQSQLHGVLNRVRDLNLVLLSVEIHGDQNTEDS